MSTFNFAIPTCPYRKPSDPPEMPCYEKRCRLWIPGTGDAHGRFCNGKAQDMKDEESEAEEEVEPSDAE